MAVDLGVMSLSPTMGTEFSWRTKQKKIKVHTNDQSHLGSNNWAGQWWDGCSHLFIQPLGPEDSVPVLLSQPGPPSRNSGSRGEDGQNMKQKREWRGGWVAQRLSICLRLRAWSRRYGIEPHIRLLRYEPASSSPTPLLVFLSHWLSLSLSNK